MSTAKRRPGRLGPALLMAALLLGACRGGIEVGKEYRPPVDYQMSINHGVNYEADLMACQGVADQYAAEEELVLGSAGGAAMGGAIGAGSGLVASGITVMAAASSGAVLGASVGAAAAGLLLLHEQSETVSDCMANRGYVVLR